MLSAIGLVSHWTGDNTALDSVGTNHGTLVSGATYSAGQIGQAFSFDGINDRVGIADSASLKLTGSLSIEAWIKADDASGVIFFRGDDRGGLDPYNFSFDGAGLLQFAVTTSANVSAVLRTSVPLGQFVHVVGTLDDATGAMGLYVNGVLMAQNNTALRPFGDLDPASNPGVGIGNHGGYPATPHNFPFDGLIDDLKVYDRALTSQEVLDDFNAGKGALAPTVSISDVTVVEGDDSVRFLDAFVSARSGGLSLPRNVLFGPDGNVYVASHGNDSVLRYDANGNFLDVFVASGSGGLDGPGAMAFGPDGNLYVASPLTGDVLRFQGPNGAQAGQFIDEYVSAEAFGINQAKGLAFGADGHLYVTNSSGGGGAAGPHEVLRFQGPQAASPGAALPAVGQSGAVFVSSGSGELSNPSGLTFGPDGRLYVVNTFGDSVNRYDASTGAFIDKFVAPKSGGLDIPTELSFGPDGFLYVTSSTLDEAQASHHQVLRYNGTDGSFAGAVMPGGSGGLNSPSGIAFDSAGNLYVASLGTSEVLRYGRASEAVFLVTLNAPFPTAVTVNYTTSNGTAGAGDYTTTSGAVTFEPGVTRVTVRVPILNDSDVEPNETFTVTLSGAVGATIADGVGVGTIVDDETPPTKFYVVNDATANRTYEYAGNGAAGDNYALNSGNAAPRGAAATAAGDKVWVVDANRTVYVYNDAGALLGSWTLGSVASNAEVEGIATNGTDVWVVDNKSDKVYRYAGAATRLTGSQNAASSFALNSGNKDAKDLVTDGTHIWVVNDAATNKVFKYTTAGALVGSWTIASPNATPTGITLDPTGASNDLWIVDSGTDRVYQYAGGKAWTSGTRSASATFNLAAGNTNPQGIADPPAPGGAVLAMPVEVAANDGADVSTKRVAASTTSSAAALRQVLDRTIVVEQLAAATGKLPAARLRGEPASITAGYSSDDRSERGRGTPAASAVPLSFELPATVPLAGGGNRIAAYDAVFGLPHDFRLDGLLADLAAR